MAPRVVGVALLVILLVGVELVAVPEARKIQRASGAVAGGGESTGVRRPSKWNRGMVLCGDKRSVPGGPDPQHHN
ncbi:unnamed protein product [Miscanthus lutarioriparius]|uniref:Uncharacterized protein n=1 Tax=Miscanthus lutarioriparius TaxID=422564 RepID=A0A811RP05_9POAL|nr:unnamed protein product [Miscanthus lutarioriparius]